MNDAEQAIYLWRHGLNNLLGKILAATELALDRVAEPEARQDLETILRLAEEGGALLAVTADPPPEAGLPIPTVREGTAFRRAMLNALDGIAYLADAEGRVIEVGEPAWTESLRRYGADSGDMGPIVGQRLFDLMRGADVQQAYQEIHQAVLTGRRPHVAFEMRCDGPDVRRVLRMSVSVLLEPSAPPAVLYQSQLLSATPRPWMSLFDPQRIVDHIRQDSGLPIVKICSFCHRVAWPIQNVAGWVPAEDYYRLGGPPEMRTSHGVCPHCAEDVAQSELAILD